MKILSGLIFWKNYADTYVFDSCTVVKENCGPPDRDASKTEIEQYVLFFRKME